jgi:CRISPR/Cas system-associated exonuclease Cas4 (RecB family)
MLFNSKLLVYPTSRSIREYVNSQKEFNTLLPTITTIDEFFKKSINLNEKKYIDEEERFLYLTQAVKNINLDSLGISSNFMQFLKQSEYIYRFFLELASENVDLDDISSEDTYGFYEEHLKILKQILKNYLNILDLNNAIDKININRYFNINEEFVKRYNNIEINFEGYFTAFEFSLVKEISKLVNVEINFIYNEYNKKSIEKFINDGVSLELGFSYKINFTEKEIISKKEIVKQTNNLHIKAFSSRVNQIAFIKESVVSLVNSGINPSKIALILPEETFANNISLFDKEAYFNYAMGINIYTTNLYKTIDAIYLYMSDVEIKNIKNLEFLNLDKELIDKIFYNNWNKNLTKDSLNQVLEYFIACEKDDELLEKFKELIFKLERLFFSTSENILLKDAYKILHQKVSKITLDDVNSGKITVMGLLESRRLVFDAVIICDFNESQIPKRSLKDKFLSSNIKQKVNLPTKLDRENLQKYYYERLISNTKNVYISYVKNDSNQISRFANLLFDIELDDIVYDNSYKHILYNTHKIDHFNEEIKLDIDLSKLTWSASSLKEYLECKRKYYFNHILKIKEHDISLKPKGYELGNIVHNCLETYYKQDNRSYEKLLEIFNKTSHDSRKENSFLNLDLEIWKRKLNDFYQKEQIRFEDNFKVLDLEKAFLIDFDGIKLRGTIDRIDRKDNSYYVIDYKTSSSLKISTKKTYEKAVDFQLEFYYLAVAQLYNTFNINTYYYDLHNMKLLEEVVLDEKLELLKDILNSFNTKQVSFIKCDNNQTCLYCNYKTICNR